MSLLEPQIANIVLLGDCQIDGNLLCADEIIPEVTPIEYGLVRAGWTDQVVDWFLRCNPQFNTATRSPMLEKAAIKYLRDEEKKRAFPAMSKYKLTNLSAFGVTAWRYKLWLENYLKTNTIDLLIIFDYSPRHQFHNVRYGGKTYFSEISYDRRHPFEFNERINRSIGLQKAVYESAKKQFEKGGLDYLRKRNYRLFQWFISYVNTLNIPFITINLDPEFTDHYDWDWNFTKHYLQYTNPETDGTDFILKRAEQPIIASKLDAIIEEFFNGKKER